MLTDYSSERIIMQNDASSQPAYNIKTAISIYR
jgi:hypothetical protein